MPRRWTVCDHPQKHAVNEALVSGTPYRSVARRFRLTGKAVHLHKTKHLSFKMAMLAKQRRIAIFIHE
jgi:hypothetical protein